MTKHGYNRTIKDYFEVDRSFESVLAFPCCVCEHRHGSDRDEPCNHCEHNCMAIQRNLSQEIAEGFVALANKRNNCGAENAT